MYGAGPTIILLHGQPGTAADWKAVAQDLSSDYRVVVPDRLGYGRTGGPAGGFAANARAVARLLAGLGPGPAVVVGHSWAGGAALETALDFPGRVAAVGLVASVVPGEPLSRLDRLLTVPVLGTALGALVLGAAGHLLSSGPGRAAASQLYKGRLLEPVHLGASWNRPSTWASFAAEQRALVHELPALGARLAQLTAPASVVVGSNDRVVGARAGERLAAAIPGAALEVVPGGGHLLPQLEPVLVAAALRRLAKRVFFG